MDNIISLRSFQKEDASQLALLANNIKIASMLRDSFPHPYTIEDAKYWINFCTENDHEKFFSKAIIYKGSFAGGIGVIRQEDIHRNSGEIGYWLGEPFWSRGIMTEAVRQMTSRVFMNTTIERLFAGVFSLNKASMRVLEKADYHLEAIHKRALIKAGQSLDEHLYVKLKD